MIPDLFTTAESKPAHESRFHTREFRRLCGLLWPFRKQLLIGTLLTVVFAGLNTAGLGGVFPIIKILLEEEGLHGWVDRWVAGKRLDVEFAQPMDGNSVRVVKVEHAGAGARPDCAADEIADPQSRPIALLLHQLSSASVPDKPVGVRVMTPSGRQEVELRPAVPEWSSRLALWAASLVPIEAGRGNITTLVYLLGGLVVMVIVANVFRYWGEVVIAAAVLRSMMALRSRLFERTLDKPITYHLAQPTSDLVSRFVQDIHEIQRGLLTLFGRCIREPLRAILILGLALTLDWRITLAMLVVAPLTVMIFWAIGRSVKKANRKLLQRLGAMLGALTNSLQNIRVVKAHAAEKYERNRLSEVDQRMYSQQLRIAKLEAASGPMVESLAILAASFLAVWLAARVLNHDLTITKFLTIGFVLSVLFDPLRKLSDVYVKVLRSTAGAERIFQVIDNPGEKELAAGSLVLGPLRDQLEYADVTFTYPGAGASALRHVNLTIRQGETAAIVGPNGSGKTTLVNMLLRFFDPDRGEILYDGVNLSEATLASLRRQFGLVSQEAVVFGGTPVENIAYGEDDPDLARVRESARKASALDFIEALPGGFHSILGERGTTLSGGQRQRLAIARAIYRNAPILIFDEATSQVDSESELAIHQALAEFTKDRTTLIIAHRLSTIQFAKRIVVMNQGQVIDSGSHTELFNRCPLYRTLCETQLIGEPPKPAPNDSFQVVDNA